jgi:hypothetical protein
VGTQVVISLPAAPAPQWFVGELVVEAGSTVVVLDDDASIHHIWDGRFESLRADRSGVELRHFSMPANLESWVRQAAGLLDKAVFLVDFELIGSEVTGLDLVRRLGLESRSILVTSRYEEPALRDRCVAMGVKMIPKGMAGFVPISIRRPLEQADAVLIDDDPLVHALWESSARDHSKRLRSFFSPDEFLSLADRFDRALPIYIDSNLGGAVAGEVVSRRIVEQGFSSVYLATGYDAEKFSEISWLAGVRGKEPPWVAQPGQGAASSVH